MSGPRFFIYLMRAHVGIATHSLKDGKQVMGTRQEAKAEKKKTVS